MITWLIALLSGEIGVFMLTSCSWPMNSLHEGHPGEQGDGITTTRIVVMADMQLSDFGSYAFAPQGSMLLTLIMGMNDAFLR
jgi:hypothetical protein